jgi:ParB/RepB/Spo0J family partition protein
MASSRVLRAGRTLSVVQEEDAAPIALEAARPPQTTWRVNSLGRSTWNTIDRSVSGSAYTRGVGEATADTHFVPGGRTGEGFPPQAANREVHRIPVAAIRPEPGLGRRRHADGHAELRRSIERFGVLNPITVRRAEDGSNDFILVKGQGRTLACRMLGIATIPAFVLGHDFSKKQKVQQFLVENAARLKMAPTDRALLIARARSTGEETKSVARRFGLSPATVRRLEQQLRGATRPELTALGNGTMKLAVQSVLARYSAPEDREELAATLVGRSIPAEKLAKVLEALRWDSLSKLGPTYHYDRISLWHWVLDEMLWTSKIADGLMHLCEMLPMLLPGGQGEMVG